MMAAAAILFISCEKRTCTKCYVITDQPGAAESKEFCGNDYEIRKEDERLKSGCTDLRNQYPGTSFACGCDK